MEDEAEWLGQASFRGQVRVLHWRKCDGEQIFEVTVLLDGIDLMLRSGAADGSCVPRQA
jgi:hypothetical protein